MASLLSFVFPRMVMDVAWHLHFTTLLGGLVLTVALTLLSGFMITFRILGQKPLAVLRQE